MITRFSTLHNWPLKLTLKLDCFWSVCKYEWQGLLNISTSSRSWSSLNTAVTSGIWSPFPISEEIIQFFVYSLSPTVFLICKVCLNTLSSYRIWSGREEYKAGWRGHDSFVLCTRVFGSSFSNGRLHSVDHLRLIYHSFCSLVLQKSERVEQISQAYRLTGSALFLQARKCSFYSKRQEYLVMLNEYG